MELIPRTVLLIVAILAAVLLFSPYEAFLEGTIAVVIVAAAVVGFAMHPRREVFYVRTSVRVLVPDRRRAIEKDLLAVRVELARLWLLFAPTFLAVAFLVFFASGGPTKFSFLNWIFTSRLAYLAFFFFQYPLLLVVSYCGNGLRSEESCGTPRRAAQDRSPSIRQESGDLAGFLTSSWESTENITAGTARTLS